MADISLLECIMCGSCHVGDLLQESAVLSAPPFLPAPHVLKSQVNTKSFSSVARREDSVAVAKIMEDVFLAC